MGLSTLLSVSALSLVYGTVFQVENYKEYVIYLALGLVVWNTIAASVQSAPNIFRINAIKIKNSNTDPIFYTLEEWAFQSQTFVQSFGIVLAALSFIEPLVIVNLLKAGLFPIVNLLVFIYWFPLLLCMAGAVFEDIYQLIPVILQLVFLLSPILYDKAALGTFKWTAQINPIYQFVSCIRNGLISGTNSGIQLGILAIVNLVGLCYSLWVLNKTRSRLPFIL